MPYRFEFQCTMPTAEPTRWISASTPIWTELTRNSVAGPVTVKNLALYGTCCTLTIASFPPVSLTAGTQYWIVADTPLTGTGSDFYGTWDFVAPNLFLMAGDHGAGWSAFDGLNNNSAGEVLGTIP